MDSDKIIEFTELDAETCTVTRDGYEFILDFSGDTPEIRVWDGREYPLAVFHVPEISLLPTGLTR